MIGFLPFLPHFLGCLLAVILSDFYIVQYLGRVGAPLYLIHSKLSLVESFQIHSGPKYLPGFFLTSSTNSTTFGIQDAGAMLLEGARENQTALAFDDVRFLFQKAHGANRADCGSGWRRRATGTRTRSAPRIERNATLFYSRTFCRTLCVHPLHGIRCIVCIDLGSDTIFALVQQEERFLCIEHGLPFIDDWLRGTDSGQHYWDLAETFLAARRAGKIDLIGSRVV
ncbi:hypothetical protein DFH08DRAFT_827425 [Mycena albidolilacea]|uniref:Uncharacterized protein n=1 Tax=Mycena albidolilacea TaxID=1033008 RepID=A0AAD7E7A9_9AGAR|nr:hypothetical protein DFH08DRAFT_827425 [Mycena albidolilacea]